MAKQYIPPVRAAFKKAKVLTVTSRSYGNGKTLLSLFVVAFRNNARKGEKPDFQEIPASVTVFDAGDLNLDKEDKITFTGELKLDPSPTWVKVKKDDRFDRNVEGKPAVFLEILTDATKLKILEKGDRTSKQSDRQARKAQDDTEPSFPHTDYDDDLPF